MRSPKAVLLLCALVFFLQSCCCMDCKQCPPRDKGCTMHPEPPFELPKDGPPGTGLVFGTVDFVGSGAVLIKIQVEELSSIPGETATITAWAGNGSVPTSTPTSSPFYGPTGDIPLRNWTSHISRGTDGTGVWVYVRVDHNSDGSNVKELTYWWDPVTTPSPDTVREFN